MVGRVAVILCVLHWLGSVDLATAQLAPTPSRQWAMNGYVSAGVTVGRTAFVFGTFGRIGGESSNGQPMAIDSTTGGRATCFTTNGGVDLSVADGAGGYYLAGRFTLVTDATGTHVRPYVVRIRQDCAVDPTFVPPANLPGMPGVSYAQRSITALAFADGRLFVGGGLAQSAPPAYDPWAPGAVVALNATTGARDPAIVDLSLPDAVSAPSSMAVAGTVVRVATVRNWFVDVDLVTRSLTPVAQVPLHLPARVWRAGPLLLVLQAANDVRRLQAFSAATLQPMWTTPDFTTSGGVLEIHDVLFDGVGLYVGGGFERLGGTWTPGVVRLDAATGGIDLSWQPLAQPRTNPQVRRLARRGSTLLISGDFRQVNSSVRTGVAALDVNTSQVTSWDPAVTFDYNGLLLALADVVVTGPGFQGGVPRNGAAAIDLDTGAIRPWTLQVAPPVGIERVAVAGSQLWLAGLGVGLARVPIADGSHVPVPPVSAMNGSIGTLFVDGGTLYVAGILPNVPGKLIAALDATDGRLLPWTPPTFTESQSAGGPYVNFVYASGSRLFVAGTFTAVGGQPRHRFAALDATTGSVLPLTLDAFNAAGFASDGSVLFITGTDASLGQSLRAVTLSNLAVLPYAPRFSGFWFVNPQAILNGRMYGSGREIVLSSGSQTVAPCDKGNGAIVAGDGIITLGHVLQLCPQIQPIPPPAPQNLTAQTVGNSVTLSWNPSGADLFAFDGAAQDGVGVASSYVVRAGSGSGLFNLADVDTGTLATSLTATAPNGTYFVRVHAKNAFGLSPASNEVSFTLGAPVCGGPPSAPGTLAASVSGVAVSFTWGAASGAGSYVLEAGAAPGLSNLATVNVGTGLSFAATAPPGTYYVRVRGSNACGLGPASNEVPITLGTAVALPGAPTSLAYTVGAGNTVSLTWAAPASGGAPTGYVLEAGSAQGLANIAVAPVAGLGLVAANVPAGSYFVRVRAINAVGPGPATADVVVTVP